MKKNNIVINNKKIIFIIVLIIISNLINSSPEDKLKKLKKLSGLEYNNRLLAILNHFKQSKKSEKSKQSGSEFFQKAIETRRIFDEFNKRSKIIKEELNKNFLLANNNQRIPEQTINNQIIQQPIINNQIIQKPIINNQIIQQQIIDNRKQVEIDKKRKAKNLQERACKKNTEKHSPGTCEFRIILNKIPSELKNSLVKPRF